MPVHPDVGRRTHLHVEVGAAMLNDELEQLVEIQHVPLSAGRWVTMSPQ